MAGPTTDLPASPDVSMSGRQVTLPPIPPAMEAPHAVRMRGAQI